jgi:hypothetical protein
VTDEGAPVFERGDIVYGNDPFKGDEDARPWLIVSNHEERAFHGEQYIALALLKPSEPDRICVLHIEAEFSRPRVFDRGGTLYPQRGE